MTAQIKARVAVFADLLIDVPVGFPLDRQKIIDELPACLRLEQALAELALCVEFAEDEVGGLCVKGHHEHGDIKIAQVHDIQVARLEEVQS